MLNNKTLRNISKHEFRTFLMQKEIKNVVKLSKGVSGDRNDYTNIIRLLNKEMHDPKSNVNENNLNEFLKQKFFYEKNNFHILYKIDSFFYKNSITFSEIEPILNKDNIKFQDNLIHTKYTKGFELLCTEVSTIHIDDIEYVTNIQFLIHIDEVNTKRDYINFHSTIDLDLFNGFASFKFNQNLYESFYDKNRIVSILADMIQDKKGIFSPFKIELSTHNQVAARRAIQKLFIELSQQAEKILSNKTPKDVNKKINDFLTDINIEQSEDYINQIIAVIYQDISKTFSKSLFDDGWAFRFVFKEGDNTRASSSNDDFEPVYSKKVYWNLKELMFKKKGTDFVEAGLLWHINDGKNPVSVKLEQRNNLITVLYYKNNHNLIMRKEKESYVLRKIREALLRK